MPGDRVLEMVIWSILTPISTAAKVLILPEVRTQYPGAEWDLAVLCVLITQNLRSCPGESLAPRTTAHQKKTKTQMLCFMCAVCMSLSSSDLCNSGPRIVCVCKALLRYNSHLTFHSFKLYNSVFFGILQSYATATTMNSRIFHNSKKKPCTL